MPVKVELRLDRLEKRPPHMSGDPRSKIPLHIILSSIVNLYQPFYLCSINLDV